MSNETEYDIPIPKDIQKRIAEMEENASKPWQDWEIEVVKKKYQIVGPLRLSKILTNHTHAQIKYMAQKLELTQSRD